MSNTYDMCMEKGMTNELFPTEKTVESELELKDVKKTSEKDNQVKPEKKLTPKERKVESRYEDLKLYKNPDSYAKVFIELYENKSRTTDEEKKFKRAVVHQMSIVSEENNRLKLDESIKTPEEKKREEDRIKILCGVLLIDFVKKNPEYRSIIDAHAKKYMKPADLKIVKY